MPDTSEIEEQNQIARIFEKWKKFKRQSLVFTLTRVFVCGVIFSFCASLKGGVMSQVVPFFAVFMGSTIGMVASQYRIKKFVKALSQQGRDVLSHAPEENYAHYCINAPDIIRESQRLSPPKELLRPSQQTTDDTLLRAAHSSYTTPQEQLLRPSQNENQPMQ